jgi:hypothetical protein
MGRTTLSKTLVWKVAALGAGSVSPCFPVHATPASAGNTVKGLYEVLLTTMKNGRILGQSGRFTQLDPVTESFARYISATYADRFDS